MMLFVCIHDVNINFKKKECLSINNNLLNNHLIPTQ